MRGIEYLEELTSRYPTLEVAKGDVPAVYGILRNCYVGDGKVMIARSDGSCADSRHIVGELMEGFAERRPVSDEFTAALKKAGEEWREKLTSRLQGGLPTIAFTGHAGLSAAFPNDVNEEMIYAQQLYDYRKESDVFMGTSTSGNIEDMMYVAAIVKAFGIKTIGLTGKNGEKMAGICGYSIVALSDGAFKIQELHLPICHTLYLIPEEHFYKVQTCTYHVHL